MAILHQLICGSYPSGYDADAHAYFDAVAIAGVTLDSTQKTAWNTFVLALKSASIWSSMVAIYPYIGGTAAAHAINAKTPGTYNITWNGTITHDSNGVTSDGSTGYGNTGLNPSSVMSSMLDISMGVYARGHTSAGGRVMGCRDGGWHHNVLIGRYSYGIDVCGSCFGDTVGDNVSWNGGSFVAGLLSTISRGISDCVGFQGNSTTPNTYTISSSGVLPNQNLYILASNQNGSPNISTINTSFDFYGHAITNSQYISLQIAVQSLQTALSRQV